MNQFMADKLISEVQCGLPYIVTIFSQETAKVTRKMANIA